MEYNKSTMKKTTIEAPSLMTVLQITKHGCLLTEKSTDITIKDIRQIMNEQNLRQYQLAKLLGVNKSIISRVLAKKDKMSLQAFLRIYHALGYEMRLVLKENGKC